MCVLFYNPPQKCSPYHITSYYPNLNYGPPDVGFPYGDTSMDGLELRKISFILVSYLLSCGTYIM